jgi:hypothetical protein
MFNCDWSQSVWLIAFDPVDGAHGLVTIYDLLRPAAFVLNAIRMLVGILRCLANFLNYRKPLRRADGSQKVC